MYVVHVCTFMYVHVCMCMYVMYTCVVQHVSEHHVGKDVYSSTLYTSSVVHVLVNYVYSSVIECPLLSSIFYLLCSTVVRRCYSTCIIHTCHVVRIMGTCTLHMYMCTCIQF